MTEPLMERDGRPAPSASRIQHDAKGAPFFTRPRPCVRCGGAGASDRWLRTGRVCFDCNGSGKGTADETVKLYTAEQIAKLDAAQAKRNAKRTAAHAAKVAAEQAEAAARRAGFEAEHADLLPWLHEAVAAQAAERDVQPADLDGFLADMLRTAERRAEWTPAQVEGLRKFKATAEARAAERARSRHVGQPGDRLDLTVTVQRVSSYQRTKFNAPWLRETVWIVTMRDADGNALVSKSPSFCPDEGSSLRIRATVKAHDDYRGEAQTVLTRVQDAADAARRREAHKQINAQIAAA